MGGGFVNMVANRFTVGATGAMQKDQRDITNIPLSFQFSFNGHVNGRGPKHLVTMELKSFVVHIGASKDGGHYEAYANCGAKGWFRFNDQQQFAQRLNLAQVKAVLPQAYYFMWEVTHSGPAPAPAPGVAGAQYFYRDLEQNPIVVVGSA